MTVTLTEKDKNRILKTLTIGECEKIITDYMDDIVKFDATIEELEIIAQIVVRIDSYIPVKSVMDRMMDIEACHCNGCRLDLNKLLNLNRISFLRDVAGITVGLDRTTGKLTNGFRPVCAE